MNNHKTLKDFALMAGVIVERCGMEYGGTWAYKTADRPMFAVCGYRSESALYMGWAKDTFGEKACKALVKLIHAKGVAEHEQANNNKPRVQRAI